MNLDFIKKNWDFSKSTKQNVTHFNNVKENRKKARIKMIIFSLIVIGLSLLFNNPSLSLLLLICAITYGSEYIFNNQDTNSIGMAVLDSTHFVVSYEDAANSGRGTSIVGTISNNNEISFGSAYNFNTTSTNEISVSALDSTHFVTVFRDFTAPYNGSAVIGTITSGNQISFGSIYNYNSSSNTDYNKVATLDSTHFVVAYRDVGNSSYGTAIIGTVSSGNQITYGSEYVFNSANTIYLDISVLDSTHFIVAYSDIGNNSYGTVIVGVVSNGDDITFGSEYVVSGTSACNGPLGISLLDSTHFVVGYPDASNSNIGTVKIGTISNDDEVSLGSTYTFSSASASARISIAKITTSSFVISYRVYIDAENIGGYFIVGTVSNVNEVSFGDAVKYNDGNTTQGIVRYVGSGYFVNSFRDIPNSGKGTSIIGYNPIIVGPANVKTYKGLVSSSVKSKKGLAIASIKSAKGLS